MEESKGLAASFQQQPPVASQDQTVSSFSTASYFGSNSFGENDPFQFAKPPAASTHYGHSQIVTDVKSQVENFVPSQQDPPTVTTQQEPISMPTISPVNDKQFFPNAAVPNANVLLPGPTADLKTSLPQDEEINPPLTTSTDNMITVTSTFSNDTGLTEQLSPTNITAKDKNNPSGAEVFSITTSTSVGQLTNVSENHQLHHSSYSHPGSRSESSLQRLDVSSGPVSLPAFPTQQYTTEVSTVVGNTGTLTNADIPLPSMLQAGPILQPNAHSLVKDGKETNSTTLLTNADISTGHGFGGMPSHSSSGANLSSLCSTPIEARTNADLVELDQQVSGVPPTTSASNSGPPTNADYKNISNEQLQLQFRPPETTGVSGEHVIMTTAVFQSHESGQALQTNAIFGNTASEMMDPSSNVNFSVGPPSQMDSDKTSDTTSMVSTQVTNVSTSVAMSLQTTSSFEVFSTTTTSIAAMSVSHSLPLTQSSAGKHQDTGHVQGEMKTFTVVADNVQNGDAIEKEFLTSPVAQSPTSAFVEYSATNSEKHDTQLHVSSGTQSVSSLLDCPDTSILASPYKIVLPSPKTVEETQSSLPPQATRMPESVRVTSSEQTRTVATSTAVHVADTPKIDPAGSTLPVTQANMTSTPKQRVTQDDLPAVVPPLARQQEPQQRYTGSSEQQHKRDFKDTSSLPPPPTRQQEHDPSYHYLQRHHHHHHDVDHQSRYDYDYRHSRGSEFNHSGGQYMEDDRGYYPPSRPHSRVPYDYYHSHPQDDYYYYRGRSEYYRDYVDDPYYYEDSRYYHERDPYHGREQPLYYDREQPRYHDARHPVAYDNYSRGREPYADRSMRGPDSYRYYQHQAQKYYHGEGPHYPDQKENVDKSDRSYVHHSRTQLLEESTVAPPEASAICGPRDHFEASQVYSEETSHVIPSYTDSEYFGHYPEQYTEQYPEQYTEQYPEQYPDQYPGHYPVEQQDQVDTVYANEETYYEQQQPVEQELPVHPAEPVVPARETPLMFAHPHVKACFSAAGKLISIVPSLYSRCIEISCVKVNTQELQSFRQSVESFPGPLIVGDTTKGEVVRYASRQAKLCSKDDDTSDEPENSTSDPDEGLLWKLLVLLCQQNGVVVPSDITDLLLNEESFVPSATSGGQSTSDPASSIDGYRKLLLEGRRKDALEYACSRSLWGHALMLASGMEEQCRTYVVNRFTASMMTSDPLNTYYTLMLGRTPSAVKPEGLARAGNWRSHLAMMMSNQSLLSSPDYVNSSIVTLGDSLLSHSQLSAAHVCYHVGGAHLSQWDDSQCKFSLLGVDHRQQSVTSSLDPSILWKTEIYEYAIGLGKCDDVLVHFQTLKLRHAFRLVEAGITDKALRYCESVAKQVSKKPDLFSASLIHLLTELSIRLHHWNSPAGLVENEVSSWIAQLQIIASNPRIGQTYSSQPPSNRSSQISPTFSSASGHLQQHHQLTLGFSSNHSSSNFLHPNQALNIPTNFPSVSTGTVSNAVQETSVDEPDNPHLTITQEQVSQYSHSHYVNTAPEQQQFIEASQENQQFSGLVSSSSDQYGSNTVPLHGSQPGMVDNSSAGTAQQLTGHLMPSWTGTGETFTQMSATIAQASGHPPQFSTAGISGSDNSQFTSRGLMNVDSTVAEQNKDTSSSATHAFQYGSSEMSTMYSEGFSTQHSGMTIQQPMIANAPVYSNFASQAPSSEPAFVQANLQNLVPNVSQQSFSTAPPFMRDSQSVTGSSQPVTSTAATAAVAVPPPPSSHSQQPGQQKEPSPKEDTGQKEDTKDNTKDEKNKDNNKEKPGSGWGFGNLIASILPKRKGEIHLPKDSKKKIVWDEKLKKWVNSDPDDEEDSGPAAPPSDSELKGSGSAPASTSSNQPMRINTTTNTTSSTNNNPGADQNIYSRRLNTKRSNAREYVNILNPAGNSSSNAPVPFPPVGAPLAATNTATFSGNFFVPSTPPVGSEGAAQERKVEDFFVTQAQPEDSQGGHGTEENSTVVKQQTQPYEQHQQQSQEQHSVATVTAHQQFNPNPNPNENVWAQQQSSQQSSLQQQQLQQQQLQQQQFQQQQLQQQQLQQQQLQQQQLQQQQLQQQQLQQQQLQQQHVANIEQISTAVTGGQQVATSSTAISATLQTSYAFTASNNTQSNVTSSTSDASYGQPQFFNPSMFSSNTSGISSGVQFTIGGSSGEQSLSRASSTSELSEEVNRHLSSGVLQQSVPPPPAAASHQPQPRSQVRRALGRHRLPQPRPHPQQQGHSARHQGQQQQWWQPTIPGHVTDYKQ